MSPASDNDLSSALEATRSGTLSSSAPNPKLVYSLAVIAGQAMFFDFEGSGLGQFRVRVEDPDGTILQEDTVSDGEIKRFDLVAEKSGRYLVRLHPLTVEDISYDLRASVNLIFDEEGNGSLVGAQLIDLGLIPTGFHDRAITLRSESGEPVEFFEIELGAGDSLSLAAEDRRVEFELQNSLGESLATSRSDIDGLSALIGNFSTGSNQSIFLEVSNPRRREYDLVVTISSPGETFLPPSSPRPTLDLARQYSNIQRRILFGSLLNVDGFSSDTYRVPFQKNQAITLGFSVGNDGEISYLLESPARVPLKEGSAGDGSGFSLTSVESGDYFLTLSSSSGELVSYTAGISGNLVTENEVSNNLMSTAYPISYGWAEIGGCSRLLTLTGQVGLGDDHFDLEPNNSLGEAQDLESSEWSLDTSSDIQDSTMIPHTSLRGTGDGTKDLYRIHSGTPNSRIICDIDRSFSLDTFLRVLDSEGNLVSENDDSETSNGVGGSTNRRDSFIDIQLEQAGVFYIEVGRDGGDGTLGNNDRYELHVSLEGHRLQEVPESDPHDFHRIDLVAGESLTLACYGYDPLLEVFENGNPLSVEFFSRIDLPQLVTYRAESDTSLIVKLSNELVSPYDLLVILNAGMENSSHSTPTAAMNVEAGDPTLALVSDDLPDFYRVSFSNDDVRIVSATQVDQNGHRTFLDIAVYNLSQELVMSSAPSLTNQVFVSVPGELGNEFYVAVTRGEQLPALYLLQVGDAATDCREVIPSGTFAVEWQVVPDQSYQVEFSPDLLNWTLIPEVVSSPNSTLQWIDAGPPRTNSAPGIDRNNRFYRLITPEE
ncbi:pre-peptidase C-terminal domain-containing protein [bacterium]|nr:pre-peptidase C-terminal domain-containing protein [bacterium]MDB2428857.1 pre-peptidase C-terminal domain-containing protein [Akkermansiaceae bacterium]